jgi:oligo-1,6-glucosidase
MKGTPYIYQGEEIGMTNRHFTSLEECRDVEEINIWHQAVDEQHVLTEDQMLACFDHVARDNARTPMQWDATDNAGFTTGEPWLEVNPNYTSINVAASIADPKSVYHYYKRLIELRHTMDIIVYGTYRPLLTDSDTIWAYERVLDGEVLTVACNWTDTEQACDICDEADEYVIGNVEDHMPGVLAPYEAYVTLRRA